MPLPGQFAVGQLYGDGLVNGLPFWTQPGGIGTQVFPAQPSQFPLQYQGYVQVPMTYPALYQAGCGHRFNCYTVWEVYDPYLQEQMALIACPACGYLQEIMKYSDFQNYEITPLITA
jgi:hypothetical protein